VIAGDFEERKALGLVQRYYGDMAGAPAAKRRSRSKEPLQRAERIVLLPAPTPSEKLLIGYHAPPFLDSDTPALVVANEVLFGGRSSRVHRRLCLDEEVALSVRGAISPFIDPGLFEMWIFVREGKRRSDALGLLDGEISALGSDGPTRLELEKAVNQIELSFLHSMETPGGKAEQIGFYETVAKNGAAVFERLAAYRDVTASDVRRVVAKYLRPSGRTRVEVVQKGS
jgi:zinc protease